MPIPDYYGLVVAAFGIGLLGSPHCLAMCGGVGSALGLQARRPWLIAHQLGRISSYALAGLLAGGLANAGLRVSTELTLLLRGMAAAIIVMAGLSIGGFWQGITRIEVIGAHLWRRISPVAQRFLPARSFPTALLVGFCWGWLPCGLVYSTLLWSTASTGTAPGAALVMTAFGLGTCPALLATGMLASTLGDWLSRKPVRQSAGALLVVFGIWTLLSPLQHTLHTTH